MTPSEGLPAFPLPPSIHAIDGDRIIWCVLVGTKYSYGDSGPINVIYERAMKEAYAARLKIAMRALVEARNALEGYGWYPSKHKQTHDQLVEAYGLAERTVELIGELPSGEAEGTQLERGG